MECRQQQHTDGKEGRMGDCGRGGRWGDGFIFSSLLGLRIDGERGEGMEEDIFLMGLTGLGSGIRNQREEEKYRK